MKRFSLVTSLISCALITLFMIPPVRFAAHAVELDGVSVPATIQVGGKTLYLNGYGERTYSVLGIHIYAASLYLEHLSTDPEEIIESPEIKLLSVRFAHAINADQARDAWRTGLANNCVAPCHLDPRDVETFLSRVPAMTPGEYFYLEFTQNKATITANGEQIGQISQPQFANAMLATFLGPHPASTELKQELLRGHS